MSSPDFSGLLRQAQEMQQQMLSAQDSVDDAEVTGSSPQGLVTVTVNGQFECTGCAVKPEVIDPDDPDTLQDLIVAAVDDALAQLAELRDSAQANVLGGLDLGSLDLGALGGMLEGLGGLGGLFGGAAGGDDDDDDGAAGGQPWPGAPGGPPPGLSTG